MFRIIPPDCEADALELMGSSPEYFNDPESLMIHAQEESRLRTNVKELNDLQGLVLCLHYGIYGFVERPLKKVSEGLHRPESTIRSVHKRAIKRLRCALDHG